MWTLFSDLSGGGHKKTDWTVIAIEAPMSEACDYFQALFGISPFQVTCTCCGNDFNIREKTDIYAGGWQPDPKYTRVISADDLRANAYG